ncbi:MAG: alpha/beta hydrolase-fold protein [Candidatus Acidiferrales bacterium]
MRFSNEVEEFRDGLLQAFGPPGDPRRAQNDVFSLACAAGPAKLSYLYLDCGSQDGFLATNRQFATLLQSRSIPYEYHELPGGHEWPYWDSRLPIVLTALMSRIQS